MIQINDKKYNDYSTNIKWGNFEVNAHNQKRTGIAPLIAFNINDKIFIGLELTFSDTMIENCKLHTKMNISKYLSDIYYEDKNGWTSLITEKYDCNMTRINEHSFQLNFIVECEEIKIFIEDTMEL